MPRQRQLPKDTHRVIDRHLGACENLGLVLDKYQPWDRVSNRAGWDLALPFEDRRKDKQATGGEAIGLWFRGEEIAQLPPDQRRRQPTLRDGALDANHRLTASKILVQALKRWRLLTKDFVRLPEYWTVEPLVIGLGASNTLETGMTLHPLYGFPYIPGSSIKGLARAAAFYDLAEKLGVSGLDNESLLTEYADKPTPFQLLNTLLEADAKPADWPHAVPVLQDLQREKHVDHIKLDAGLAQPDGPLFRQVFGTLGYAGQICFYDALPATIPEIVTEVMTPHFPAYYNEGKNPDDADSPNPVTYLTVKPGTPFHFAIGWRHGRNDLETAVRQSLRWLAAGLQSIGLGGKTSSGFGRFSRQQPAPMISQNKGPSEEAFEYHGR